MSKYLNSHEISTRNKKKTVFDLVYELFVYNFFKIYVSFGNMCMSLTKCALVNCVFVVFVSDCQVLVSRVTNFQIFFQNSK